MPADPRTQAEQITHALAGPHHPLYMTSPSFHQAVDTLAAWLPVWVQAMATEAQRADYVTHAAVDLMRRHALTAEQAQAMADEVLRRPAHEHDIVAIPVPMAHNNDVCRRRHQASGAPWLTQHCPSDCACNCHPPTLADVTAAYTARVTDEIRARQRQLVEDMRHRYEPGPDNRCNLTACRLPREDDSHTADAPAPPGFHRANLGTLQEYQDAMATPEVMLVHVGVNAPDDRAQLALDAKNAHRCGWPADGHTPSPLHVDTGTRCGLPAHEYRATSPEDQTVTYCLPVCGEHADTAASAGWETDRDVAVAHGYVPPDEPRRPCHTGAHVYEPTTSEGGPCRVCADDLGGDLHLHSYYVDDDGVPCCFLPVDSPTHQMPEETPT